MTRPRKLCFWRSLTFPTNSALPISSRGLIFSLKYRLWARGTLAAILKRKAGCLCHAHGNVRAFFGGDATQKCKVFWGRSHTRKRSAGKPWWMVACQFRSGTGLRWLCEIETNGHSGNLSPTMSTLGRSSRPCRRCQERNAQLP